LGKVSITEDELSKGNPTMTKTAIRTTASNTSNLSAVIDAYGELKAMLAELAIKEKALKDAMADLAPGNYDGELFRINIFESTRESPDEILKAEFKAVVDEYRETLSRQYLQAHLGETKIRTHKVTVRSGKRVTA
jgi:hypothetical protein